MFVLVKKLVNEPATFFMLSLNSVSPGMPPETSFAGMGPDCDTTQLEPVSEPLAVVTSTVIAPVPEVNAVIAPSIQLVVGVVVALTMTH